MPQTNYSMSLSNPHPANFNGVQKLGLAFTGIGVLATLLAWAGIGNNQPLIFLIGSLASFILGGVVYSVGTYTSQPAGIKNNRIYFSSMTSWGGACMDYRHRYHRLLHLPLFFS